MSVWPNSRITCTPGSSHNRHVNNAGQLHWTPRSGTLKGALQDVGRTAFHNTRHFWSVPRIFSETDTEKTVVANFSMLVLACRDRAERRATVRTQTQNDKLLTPQHECQQQVSTPPCAIYVRSHDSGCSVCTHAAATSVSVALMFPTCYFPRKTSKTGNVLYVQSDTEGRSRNHRYRGKAISMTCFRFLWPCIVSKIWRQKTNKMQQLDVYY